MTTTTKEQQLIATKERQLKALLDLQSGRPLPVRVVGEVWLDDHLLCCKLGILQADGEVEVDLMWVGWQGVAAATYAAHCIRARQDLIEHHIAATIEDLQEEIADK